MQALIAVLDQLEQEAVRVLDILEPSMPDHETVARLVVDLRDTRARLASARQQSRLLIDRSVEQLSSAQAVLDKLNRVEPAG